MPSSTATSYSLFVKKSCPTCELIEPVAKLLYELLGSRLTVYIQDDMSFLEEINQRIDDGELEQSYRQNIEIVPTLIRHDEDEQRIVGWEKQQWQEFTGIPELGAGLIDFKPGCGSLTEDPGMAEKLAAKFDSQKLKARRIELADAEDDTEACFDRGWSDGLPVVPPTPVRVMRMLAGTELEADELIGIVPPDNIPCSVEKVAINAVMAGCKPEYLPTVIAVVRAALQDRFCMHGLLCTTYFSSPVVIVNGPESRHIGMNSGGNALGQGNRANATIGRALQLLIRNVGGGKPGGIDRATLGTPGKYTFCFAEDESDDAWPNLAMDQGYQREESVVSLFAGDGVQPILDQLSRTPQSLAKSMAASLRSVVHVKKFALADAVLVVCPEHRRVLRTNGWNKQDLLQAIHDELVTPGTELVSGTGGIAEGMPQRLKDKLLSKFRDDGLHIVTAGGTAGMFSAIISGWVASGERGSQLVSQRI
ncbi:MAG: thiol reductase thioredoxin [Gammaproteobacteria bacterium TMED107]|nr:thiol reductase thioredoxin [Gammaproteobacteria bacterium]OUX76077.1 MAG: thiol reductase thioredoxin [Gammaproteobacteria bacterium TMED107]